MPTFATSVAGIPEKDPSRSTRDFHYLYPGGIIAAGRVSSNWTRRCALASELRVHPYINLFQKRRIMDEAKKKQLEAKLRQMFLNASQTKEEDRPTPSTPRVIRVIRRRKGQPDTQIA